MTKDPTNSVIEIAAGLCLTAVLASRIWMLFILSGEARIGTVGILRLILETALILLSLYGLIKIRPWARLLGAAMLLWAGLTTFVSVQSLTRPSSLLNSNLQVWFAGFAVLAGFALIVRQYLAQPNEGGGAQ